MSSSAWSDNSIPARPDPKPSIYTPPSTKPSSTIKPYDTDDEVYVQIRVAGKWTHVKLPAQTAEELIAEGVPYPPASSTEALEQVPTYEAPMRGADNSTNTCSSDPLPSFAALASQCYNKKLPANPRPSLRSKMPGTHNFTLVELASGAKKLVSGSVYPDRVEEPAMTANVPTKPRLGNDPTSSLVSDAGSGDDLNAATADATNLRNPLPFESHFYQYMANKDALPLAASALPQPSTNEDVTNVDPFNSEGDAQRAETTQDEVSPTPEHTGSSCAVCDFEFSDRISFEQECPLCGVAVDYIRTRDTYLFLSDRDRSKAPTLPQAFARFGIDPSQANSVDVIEKKLRGRFDERPSFMPELFKAMAVIFAESAKCGYNDDHRKTGGIDLGTEKTSAETQNNEQSEPIPLRDCAWGPSMETFQADKDDKYDIPSPSRQDSEEEVPWWGRRNGAGFGGNEDNETKASSAAELQSDTASANNGWPPETPPSKDLAVTYWATIESGNHTVHIPIDADDVVAQEKVIIDTSMKKVWNWIQDKKLEDKISLQDAFDLAREMHPDPIEADEDRESDNDPYEY